MVAKREFTPLDADRAADLFELTQQMTSAAGIPAYEISNHARPGQESLHNLTYWRYGDYAGVGPGATEDALECERYATASRKISCQEMRRNGHGMVEEEALTAREAADEALVMGLRLAEGVDAECAASALKWWNGMPSSGS